MIIGAWFGVRVVLCIEMRNEACIFVLSDELDMTLPTFMLFIRNIYCISSRSIIFESLSVSCV